MGNSPSVVKRVALKQLYLIKLWELDNTFVGGLYFLHLLLLVFALLLLLPVTLLGLGGVWSRETTCQKYSYTSIQFGLRATCPDICYVLHVQLYATYYTSSYTLHVQLYATRPAILYTSSYTLRATRPAISKCYTPSYMLRVQLYATC